MPLDSNGIWQYDAIEDAAPFSAMLNRLAGSVSDTVAPMVNPGHTAWTSAGVAAGSGVTLNSVQYMVDRWGQVKWRGELYRSSGQPAENALLLSFPSSISPSQRLVVGMDGFAGSARVFVGSFGGTGSNTELRFRTFNTGAIGSSSTVGLSLGGLTWSRV